ncbi:heavy metal translocating P-type ATPase [Brumimicrobium sp.]|uniref:heavy metal translocating P-type ATPase n=1 Tax=Brumimicrobium sp. TaxID=2029867 RepID=UPI003A941A10
MTKKIQIKTEGKLNAQQVNDFEQNLIKINGIKTVSSSDTGWIDVEFNATIINQAEIIVSIQALGLTIADMDLHTIDDGTQNKDDNQHHGHDHRHLNLQIFGENTELYFALLSGLFWIIGLLFSFSSYSEEVATSLFIVGALFGGVFTLVSATLALLKGLFQIDFLMLFAAVGAAALGKWGESALLLFLFSLGHALEHYAMKRARKSISALSDLAPPMALVKRNNQLVEVHIEELEIGDIVVVRPNSKISADGLVIKGSSAVNQAAITGESMPITKHPNPEWENENEIKKIPAENRVFAGTINGTGALEIKVLKKAKDSTLSKLIYLVKEAETQKSPTQHLTDQFEKYYVPSVLVTVILLLFAFLVIDETVEQSFYRAMSVLIAASPCALAISTPSAVLAGIARAARKGVLIKGGRPLEDLGEVNAIAFDKTGTLTEGTPKLTHAVPFGEVSQEYLLKASIAVEELSDHPLAAAIVKGGREIVGEIEIPKAINLKALIARGIQAEWNGKVVHIGNRRLFEELTGKAVPDEIDQKMSEFEWGGHTAMIVHEGSQYLGVISAMDVARPEVVSTLAALKKIGIQKMVMLTGDHQQVANAIAKTIGITDPMGNLLPEDKVLAIEQLKEKGGVAMVGDGVNDAPAMAKSTVGIAMGAAGSDVALETADIALMADKLDNLPFAIGLSRKAKLIIKQNLFLSLGMVAILVPLTLMGTIAIGPAVVFHEGSTLLVVLNALRLLRYEL